MELLPVIIPGAIALVAILAAWRIKPSSKERPKERLIIIADKVVVYPGKAVIKPKS